MDLDFETKLLALPYLRSFAKTIVKNKALKSEEVQQALSTFFTNYQERFGAINKITCKDLNNGQKLSIINHDLTAQSREMFDEYIIDLDIMNVNKFVDNELDIMTAAIPAELTDCVRQKAITWHHNFLATWDKRLETNLLQCIDDRHKEKCKKEFGIYNFTNTEIPSTDFELLKNGKKVVIPTSMHANVKVNRIKDEVFDYCTRYRKFFEGNKYNIYPNGTKEDWLRLAKETAITEEASNFYTTIIEHFSTLDDTMYVTEKTYKTAKNINNNHHLQTRLDYPNAVWNEADKNRGISLISVEQMRAAENKIIKELGGVPYNGSKEELERTIIDEITAFTTELDGQQRWLITNMFGDMQVQLEETVVPFLNLKSKVHKLSNVDIKDKNFNKLTFRPVVDQSRWVINKISKSFMKLIVSVNEKLLETETLKVFKSMLPKNGAEVAGQLQSFKFNTADSMKSIISADLSDAYSNTKLSDLENAIELAGTILTMDAWKVELLISMARVIINNNYVQTSNGIFLLQKCLAMGNSSSGACLTLVGLTAEFYKINPEITDPVKGPLKPSIYFRYLDDTKAVIEGDNPDNMSSTIKNIGTMFPPTIPINVDLFHICGSFLDVITIRKLSTGSFETVLKKNLSSPPSYIPFMSAVPGHYKLAALKTEMIRIRRTCSKPIFTWHMDKLLIRELTVLGHKSCEPEMSKFKDHIKINYDENFNKKKKADTDEERTKRVYGATSKMETIGGTHQKVLYILAESLGNSEANLPMLVPSIKLKEILHSRKRYLSKLNLK